MNGLRSAVFSPGLRFSWLMAGALIMLSGCATTDGGRSNPGPVIAEGVCAVAAVETDRCNAGKSEKQERCDYWRMLSVACALHRPGDEAVTGLVAAGPRGSGYSAQARGFTVAKYYLDNVNGSPVRWTIDWSKSPEGLPEFSDAWFSGYEATFGPCTMKLCPATSTSPEHVWKRFSDNVPSNERGFIVADGLKAKCLAGLLGTVHGSDCEPTVFEVASAQMVADSWVWTVPPTGGGDSPPAPPLPTGCAPPKKCLEEPAPCPPEKICPSPQVIGPGMTEAQRKELRLTCTWQTTEKHRARCRFIVETVIRLDGDRVKSIAGALFEETTPSWPRQWADAVDHELAARAAEGTP
jgi:hypothetical protein